MPSPKYGSISLHNPAQCGLACAHDETTKKIEFIDDSLNFYNILIPKVKNKKQSAKST